MSNSHSWVRHEREGWTVCTRCGLIRNYERESPCRGAARIALREATGGEQGETAEMLEIVRLRRERIEQEAMNLEMGGEIAKLRRELAEIAGAFLQSEQYREEAHSQLAVIVDEAFGPQEVLPLPNLLARLERLLTERARQHEEVRRELDAWREWADYHSSWALIDAERPPDAELRARIGELCDVVNGGELAKSNSECAEARAERDEARRERDEARANYQFMVERAADQRLDGYRELGARVAAAENERDEARAKLEEAKRAALARSVEVAS